MTKKRSLILAFVLVVILAVGAKLLFFSSEIKTETAMEQTNIGEAEEISDQAEADHPTDINYEEDPTKPSGADFTEVPGKNFFVDYSVGNEPEPAFVQFLMADRTPIKKYTNMNGETDDIVHLTWGRTVSAEISTPLKELNNQEVIILNSAEPLMMGEGYIENRTLLVTEGDAVRELLNVTTKRTFDGDEDHKRPAIDYAGQLTCVWTEPASCDLKYKLNGKDDAVHFSWDKTAKRFVDPTGKYKSLGEEI